MAIPASQAAGPSRAASLAASSAVRSGVGKLAGQSAVMAVMAAARNCSSASAPGPPRSHPAGLSAVVVTCRSTSVTSGRASRSLC